MKIPADQAERDIIRTSLGETLVVEAAAGTGKTTELVRRMVAVIGSSDEAAINRLVAVTFSEKAAGEVKLRLREALEQGRQPAAGPEEVCSRFDRALSRLEEAHISTIHGFCADLLRERPVEAGVDPDFTVLTDPAAERLFNEVFRSWIQPRLEDPPEGIRRALRRPSFDDADPDGAAGRLRSAAWALTDWRDYTAPCRREAFERERTIETLLAELHSFVDMMRRPARASDAIWREAGAAIRTSTEIRRARQGGATDYDGWEAALVSLARNREFRKGSRGSGREYGAGVPRAQVIAARDGLLAALDAFRRSADADLAALLHRELRDCVAAYQARKRATGVVDFLDLLLLGRDLVRNHPDVRASLQNRFLRIFVDEFQDTDPLQAELLLLLAADDPCETNWTNVRPVPGKLFLVGDPKQSIYRFRRADLGMYAKVCSQIQKHGGRHITLSTSFRSTPNIQRAVNAAFAPVMTGDATLLQAGYVALQPYRNTPINRPDVVVLPVPEPYGTYRIAVKSIDKSLADATGAFVEWLVKDSGWQIEEPDPSAPGGTRTVDIAARHVCILFRRFVSWDRDVTRPYVEALEARGVPHLLVGGKAFHDREEVEALRTALAAIEWPDDELSVFAALRGPFFGVTDEELLEYRHRFGHVHPFRIPGDCPPHLDVIPEALAVLRDLHRGRNDRAVGDTITALLNDTRAHVALALRHGGEQALANVLHIAELAREYEADGGIAFRGFIEELRAAAERSQAPEAPILEEGSDGVRLMTVHKAKGLEFPVVVLADMTASIRPGDASRYVDSSRGLCALRLGGWSPLDLLDHEGEELARDEQEGIRLAYVAATRARDLLVMPAIGDHPYEEGWLQPLERACYPSGDPRRPLAAPACPPFKGDTVLKRPDGEPAGPQTAAPGLHRIACSAGTAATGGAAVSPLEQFDHGSHEVVWWDPRALRLGVEPGYGLARAELVTRDVDGAVLEEGKNRHQKWRERRERLLTSGGRASVRVRRVTDAPARLRLTRAEAERVSLVEIARERARPSGRRFGALVHAVLATIPFDATADHISALAALHGRVMNAPDEEIASAVAVAGAAWTHEPLHAARSHASARCHRELPLLWRDEQTVVEGVADVAVELPEEWLVVDFKTDREPRGALAAYRAQVAQYARALESSTGKPARAVLMIV